MVDRDMIRVLHGLGMFLVHQYLFCQTIEVTHKLILCRDLPQQEASLHRDNKRLPLFCMCWVDMPSIFGRPFSTTGLCIPVVYRVVHCAVSQLMLACSYDASGSPYRVPLNPFHPMLLGVERRTASSYLSSTPLIPRAILASLVISPLELLQLLQSAQASARM